MHLLPETFIAKRLGIRGNSSGITLRIAAVSIAISLTVMIIALSVVNGFRQQIGRKVAGFASHLVITERGSGHSFENLPMRTNPALIREIVREDKVSHAQRFAAKAGIIRRDSMIQGIYLKGVGPDYDRGFIERQLVAGTFPVFSDTARSREAVISSSLARSLRLETGDRFEVLFVGNGQTPRRDRLRVSGIYHSGMEEFDKLTVIGDLALVQRLNDWTPDQISGYEIYTRYRADDTRIDHLAREIAERHPDYFPGWFASEGPRNLEISTVREQYVHIFDWLDMLNMNSTFVIVIMLIVAVINMISGVLIVILEQTRTIGLLKALGMSNGMLQRIFIFRTASVTLRGMLLGNGLGLGFCLLQQYTGFITLDPVNYMISVVPVEVDWLAVVLLNIGTFIFITAMMSIPTWIISRITPDKAIRFQ